MSSVSKKDRPIDTSLLPNDVKNRVKESKLTVYYRTYEQYLREGYDRMEAHQKAWARLRRVAPEIFLREQ